MYSGGENYQVMDTVGGKIGEERGMEGNDGQNNSQAVGPVAGRKDEHGGCTAAEKTIRFWTQREEK